MGFTFLMISLSFFAVIGFVELCAAILDAAMQKKKNKIEDIVTIVYTSDLDTDVEHIVFICRNFLEKIMTKNGRGGRVIVVPSYPDTKIREEAELLVRDYENVEFVEQEDLKRALNRL